MATLAADLGRGWTDSDQGESIVRHARDVAAAACARSPLDAEAVGPSAATELGWHRALIPEALGGTGLEVGLLAPVAEALAIAGGYPSFAATSVDAVWILRQCGTPEADELLSSIADGSTRPVLEWGPLPGEEGEGESWVVVTEGPDAQVLRAVTSSTAVRSGATLATELPPSALESALAVGAALDAAALVGLGRQALSLTVEHACTRVQFDHPIGTFQAVQHHCVDMFLGIEQAQTLAADALRSLSGEPMLTLEVMFAKVKAAEMAVDAFRRAHRIQGGIGYSSDHPLGTLTRSALLIRGLHGSPLWHRARLRKLLRTSPEIYAHGGAHAAAGMIAPS